MLATDTALQFGTYRAAFLNSHFNQLAYTVLVEYLERVNLQNLLFEVNRQEAGNIVTRVAECHLSQVVCTE